MVTKWQEGDYVRVKTNLEFGEKYWNDNGACYGVWSAERAAFAGQVLKIVRVHFFSTLGSTETKYCYEASGVAFTDSMLEDVDAGTDESEVSSEDLMSLLNGGE